MDVAKFEGNDQVSFFMLVFLLILEGFVTISVEILTIRQLMPFVGNSVVVTSLIIGVFLLFLAFGYYRGGLHQNNYRSILIKNFIIASVILGVGLSYFFIDYFFGVSHSWLHLNAFSTLVVYLLLIVAPAVYLLGQTVPISSNLFVYKDHVGGVSGKVLFFSTVGSFLGAVLTTLVLMNKVGVAATVVINVFSLLLLVFLLLLSLSRYALKVTVMIQCVLIFTGAYTLNVGASDKMFVAANAYANYSVKFHYNSEEKRYWKVFHVNKNFSTMLDDKLRSNKYIELIKKILFKELHFKDKKILVLGSGGFGFSAESDFGNEITYVDIDKRIKDIAEKHFIKKVKGAFLNDDARNFVRNKKSKYDAIITDVFRSRESIPFSLLSVEHFNNIKRSLKGGGYAFFNVIARPTLSDDYSKRLNNTILTAFKNCMIIPEKYSGSVCNILYVCHKTTAKNDNKFYSDNFNSASLDFYGL